MHNELKYDTLVGGQRIYYSLIPDGRGYTIQVRNTEGEQETVRNVVEDKKEAQELLRLLCEKGVTPTTVRDIITDYIDDRDFISWHLR